MEVRLPRKFVQRFACWYARSPAFLCYLDIAMLGEKAVLEAHMEESSGDESDAAVA